MHKWCAAAGHSPLATHHHMSNEIGHSQGIKHVGRQKALTTRLEIPCKTEHQAHTCVLIMAKLSLDSCVQQVNGILHSIAMWLVLQNRDRHPALLLYLADQSAAATRTRTHSGGQRTGPS